MIQTHQTCWQTILEELAKGKTSYITHCKTCGVYGLAKVGEQPRCARCKQTTRRLAIIRPYMS